MSQPAACGVDSLVIRPVSPFLTRCLVVHMCVQVCGCVCSVLLEHTFKRNGYALGLVPLVLMYMYMYVYQCTSRLLLEVAFPLFQAAEHYYLLTDAMPDVNPDWCCDAVY